MTIKDSLGNTVSGASANTIQIYEKALHEFRCYIDDPVATIDRALEDSPGFVMGYVLRAYLHLLGTEPEAIAVAREALASARGLPANAHERGHLEAIARLVDGEWHAGARALEDVAIDNPRDPLALQAGHLCDFFIGASRMIRDRIARALPAWSEDMPGYHAVLGMHAFGLEETGIYDRAEASGRRAVELEPRDAWAQHAVAHVMEMQGRQREGIDWMRSNVDGWTRDNFFAVHNWWHLALFHVEAEELDEVLRLFDEPIYGEHSTLVVDMVDASSLLWRLNLRGIEVGNRWQAVADGWAPIATAGNYCFNDAHAVMAFVGAQRPELVRSVIEAQEKAQRGGGDNARFTREVGAPMTRAIIAFGEGNYAETVRLIRPIRAIAHRFGGSHAQRDLIDLTLLEAAQRDGQLALARSLASERVDLKPQSTSARALFERARSAAPRERAVA
jgi:tetratricopeptide (TPR) repeat protein